MRSDHVRPHDLVLPACQNQLDKACRLAFSLRAVDISPGKFYNAYVFVLLLGFIGRQAGTSRLWIGERTPGHNAIINFLLGDGYKCIAYCDSRLICCDMSEEITADDIPDRKNIGC